MQVVPVVFDVEPDGSTPVFNGIRDQLGDHEFEVRDHIPAQCVGEAITNRRSCISGCGMVSAALECTSSP